MSLRNKSIFVRTNGDPVADTLYEWSENIINRPFSEKFGMVREGEEVTRKNIEGDFEAEYEALIFYGHGCAGAILGNKGEEIINCENVGLVNAKVFFSVSCETALKLGTAFVKKSADKVFLGFKGKLKVPKKTDENYSFVSNLYHLPIEIGVNLALQGNMKIKQIMMIVVAAYNNIIGLMMKGRWQEHVAPLTFNRDIFVSIRN